MRFALNLWIRTCYFSLKFKQGIQHISNFVHLHHISGSWYFWLVPNMHKSKEGHLGTYIWIANYFLKIRHSHCAPEKSDSEKISFSLAISTLFDKNSWNLAHMCSLVSYNRSLVLFQWNRKRAPPRGNFLKFWIFT